MTSREFEVGSKDEIRQRRYDSMTLGRAEYSREYEVRSKDLIRQRRYDAKTQRRYDAKTQRHKDSLNAINVF
jgi:hypothetical protein